VPEIFGLGSRFDRLELFPAGTFGVLDWYRILFWDEPGEFPVEPLYLWEGRGGGNFFG
jgi:hypothetical protein